MQRTSPIRLLLVALVLVAGLSAASTAAHGAAVRGGAAEDFAPGEVIVRFDPGATGAERAQARRDARAESSRALPLARVEVLRLEPGRSVAGAVAALRGRSDVDFAQPNYLYRPEATPNDPLFSQQWGLHNTGQSGGKVDADVDAPEAWDLSVGSDSVVIGIIDTGVNVNHPDLAPNMHPEGRDFAGADDPVVDDDFSEHGTFVASVAAARGANGSGMSGVAQRAKILPLQADNGQGFIATDAVVEAVAYAKAKGAKVVNMSFGSFGLPDAGDTAIRTAIESAPEILFTVSAGNTDPDTDAANDNDVKAHWPSNLSKDHANVISVASTDRNDGLSTFSSYGATTVDLAAPGQTMVGAQAMTSAYSQTFDGLTAPALPTGWTTDGTWATTSALRDSAPNSLADSPAGDYAANANTHVTSQAISAPAGGTACKLYNESRVQLAAGDHFLTQVALNGSSSFTTLSDETDFIDPDFLAADPGFSYPASTTSLQFRFRLTSNASGQADGVNIDDVDLRCNDPEPTAFVFGSGTSYSSPAVAGAAAVLLGRNPSLTAAQLKNALKATVDPLPALADKTVTGGRMNLDRAVRSVLPPAAVTGAATSIEPTGAALSGTVDPEGVAATARFEYREAGTTNWTSTPSEAVGSGTSATPVDAPVTGLEPDTDYEFRIVATSSGGTSAGSVVGFRTAAPDPGVLPPGAITGAASNVTQSGATLNGSVDPNGAPTNYAFEYRPVGATTWTATAMSAAGSGADSVTVNSAISGLSPASEYEFRLIASNDGGSVAGAVVRFITATPPATPEAVPAAPTTTTAPGTTAPATTATSPPPTATPPTSPPAAAADTAAPRLARASVAPFAFRPLRAGATVLSAASRGARLRFALSEPARVRAQVTRPRSGRRVGGRCVAPTRSNRRAASCTRYVNVGRSVAVPGGVLRGTVHRRLSGRVSGRALAPGLYRLVLRATDAAGNRSAVRNVAFRIARR